MSVLECPEEAVLPEGETQIPQAARGRFLRPEWILGIIAGGAAVLLKKRKENVPDAEPEQVVEPDLTEETEQTPEATEE